MWENEERGRVGLQAYFADGSGWKTIPIARKARRTSCSARSSSAASGGSDYSDEMGSADSTNHLFFNACTQDRCSPRGRRQSAGRHVLGERVHTFGEPILVGQRRPRRRNGPRGHSTEQDGIAGKQLLAFVRFARVDHTDE